MSRRQEDRPPPSARETGSRRSRRRYVTRTTSSGPSPSRDRPFESGRSFGKPPGIVRGAANHVELHLDNHSWELHGRQWTESRRSIRPFERRVDRDGDSGSDAHLPDHDGVHESNSEREIIDTGTDGNAPAGRRRPVRGSVASGSPELCRHIRLDRPRRTKDETDRDVALLSVGIRTLVGDQEEAIVFRNGEGTYCLRYRYDPAVWTMRRRTYGREPISETLVASRRGSTYFKSCKYLYSNFGW